MNALPAYKKSPHYGPLWTEYEPLARLFYLGIGKWEPSGGGVDYVEKASYKVMSSECPSFQPIEKSPHCVEKASYKAAASAVMSIVNALSQPIKESPPYVEKAS